MSNVSEVLGQKAIEWMNGLEALTKQYAPKVVDAALTVIQVDGFANLAQAFFIILFCGIVIKVGIKPYKAEFSKGYDGNPFIIVLGGVVAVVMCIACIVCLFCFLDVWNWVAIFQPKLAVAHMIFDKVAK